MLWSLSFGIGFAKIKILLTLLPHTIGHFFCLLNLTTYCRYGLRLLPTDHHEAPKKFTVSHEQDIEYPKDLCRALWEERSGQIIDLLLSSRLLDLSTPGKGKKRSRSSEDKALSMFCFLSLSRRPTIIKTPEQEKTALRRRMLTSKDGIRMPVTIGAGLLLRHVIRQPPSEVSLLEYCLLAYYVCTKFHLRLPWDELPQTCFQDYHDPENQSFLNEVLTNTQQHLRTLYVLTTLNNEVLPHYCTCYQHLAEEVSYNEEERSQSIRRTFSAVAKFLQIRRFYRPELRKAYEECKALHALDPLSDFARALGSLNSFVFCVLDSYEDLIKKIGQHYEARLPRQFNAQETITLLESLTPPLEPHDLEVARAEAENVSNKTTSSQKSALIRYILPSLYGEISLSFDDLQPELLQGYSFTFIAHILAGKYDVPPELIPPQSLYRPHLPGDQTSASPHPSPQEDGKPEQAERKEAESGSDATLLKSQDTGEKQEEDIPSPETETDLHEDAQSEEAAVEGEKSASSEEEFLPVHDEKTEIESGEREPQDQKESGQSASKKTETEKEEEEKSITPDRTEEGVQKEEERGRPSTGRESRDTLIARTNSSRPSSPLGLLEAKLLRSKEEGDAEPPNDPGTPSEKKTVREKAEDSLPSSPTPLSESVSTCYIAQVLRQDTQALFWLSATLERTDSLSRPCPPWLAEFLHYGLHLLPGCETLTTKLVELAAQAISQIDTLNDRQCLLLAAAILRPSLLMPVMDLATIASSLALRLSKYACTTFLQHLNQFIARGKPMDASLFMGQSADSQRKFHFLALKDRTHNFLQRCKSGRLPDQSAVRIRNDILSETGYLGKFFVQCMAGNFTDLKIFLSTSCDLERLIDTSRYYPSTKKISEFPRKKLLENLKETVALLQEWGDFCQTAQNRRAEEQSYMVEAYVRLFADVEEAMGKVTDVPEGHLLANTLQILRNCPVESLPEEPCDPKTQLELWPYTIPVIRDADGLLPIADLLDCLMSPSYAQETTIVHSLALHMANGEMINTDRYLEQFPAFKNAVLDLDQYPIPKSPKNVPSPLTLQDFYEQCQEHFSASFKRIVSEVRKLISEYSFRSVIHFQQQSQYNSRLEDIINTYGKSKQKMARGLTELSNIKAELQQCDQEKKKQVKERINELLAQTDISSEARTRLEEVCSKQLEMGMYNAVYADIVNVEEHLSKGKPLRSLTQSEPSEDRAAHDFYDFLQTANASRDILVPIWDKAKRFLRNRPLAGRTAEPRDVSIVTELLRWLGFTLDQSEQAKNIYSAGRPNFWRVIQYHMEIAGPIPHWGSRQSRHTIAFGWDTQAEDVNQLFNSSHFTNDDAVTVLCFSQFDKEARQKLLTFCASRHMAPLIIDTNLVNFLSAHDGKRTEILFRVALAGAAINPYLPDIAGSVPREMFFGRQDDIRAVMAKDGPCIIYGGRQLGKSALLQQIYKGQTPSMKVLLHSMRPVETSLLDAALSECQKAQIVPPQTTQNTFSDNILEWLSANPDKRILILLDECDRAFEFDAQKDFSDAVFFRNLMQKSERRFKVVFTGLHSVQRFSQYPNNPLYHFGDPLCIGPLSPEAANALMCYPTSLLGLEFNEQLVQIALNHCNYQPKLIQIFCSELVQALNERPNRGPFHTIDKDTFVRIYESHNLKRKILECFEMTLNLDERYLVIGYVMAISHGRGYSLNELLHELREYWPAAFGGETSDGSKSDVSNTLRCLLHEMEGLGLVISLGGKYRLRTPNVVDLLGGEDFIFARLDPYQNKEYRPSGNPDELRLPGMEPLVASQYNLLCEKKKSFYWISGSNALGLNAMPRVLERLADDSKLQLCRIQASQVEEAMRTMRREYDALSTGGILFWLNAAACDDMAGFLQQADSWLTKLHAHNKYVKIVILVDPTSLFSWVQNGLSEAYSSYQIELQPWTLDGIEGWCKEKALPGIDSRETMKLTGGWTFLVEEVLTRQDHLSLNQFRNPGFCLPDNQKLQEMIVRYAEELGSEYFSEDDVLQWLYGIYAEEESIDAVLNTCLSLKILRQKGNQLCLEPVLVKALEENAR